MIIFVNFSLTIFDWNYFFYELNQILIDFKKRKMKCTSYNERGGIIVGVK